MDYDYRLPDTDAPAITVRRTGLGGVEVFVDGARVRGRQDVYEVPGPDGETHLVRIAGQWSGLRAIADGWNTPLEPPVRIWARALAVLPFALVPVGALIGGLAGGPADALIGALVGLAAGGLGAAINSIPLRSSAGSGLRASAMVGVLVVATGIWLAVAGAITGPTGPKPIYATGACLDGVTAGADLVVQAPAIASCAAVHDSEVVGTFRLDAAASYPGEAALTDDARNQCPALFASYVGIDFGSSRLDIVPVIPTEASWLTGDREVACVAIAIDGSKLTGSVKGSRQ